MSALVGKVYSAAGQAAVCLHTMYLLQAYQAELLGDHNEGGGGCGPNAVCELRRATDLSVRARDLHRYFEGLGLKWKKGHLYFLYKKNSKQNVKYIWDVWCWQKYINIFCIFINNDRQYFADCVIVLIS